jgi:hypothetical protein
MTGETKHATATGLTFNHGGLILFIVLCPYCQFNQLVRTGDSECIHCSETFYFSPFPSPADLPGD